MSTLNFKNVKKNYGDVEVVKGFDLHIADGEFVVLLGASGCGKSTTLRMVAGLEDISSGEVVLGGRVINKVNPKDRDLAMVFQSYALYPHMTVYQNIAFALKLSGMSQQDIDERVQWASKMLNLETLLQRKPKALSGGQRQRVAMGRAMVRTPKLFLFDEPLSNLDAKLRGKMRSEIKALHRELGVTTLYVTHDQIEAMTLADRIVIMDKGVISQIGSPEEVFCKPNNRFVAGFIGNPTMNFFAATIEQHEGQLQIQCSGHYLPLPERFKEKASVGQAVELGLRPTDLHVRAERVGHTDISKLPVTLLDKELLGASMLLNCEFAGCPMQAEIASESFVLEGDKLDLVVDMTSLHLFDLKQGHSLAVFPNTAGAGLASVG
ncbi:MULTISPECIES: ABC transporter ATP-binding protein [unclassified Agarivorans]|uniref:ABC transporter ATP-binding protein n=1 Tax=unclassified Agarivorans TaxID=2636026 RepID=UPI003D7DB116